MALGRSCTDMRTLRHPQPAESVILDSLLPERTSENSGSGSSSRNYLPRTRDYRLEPSIGLETELPPVCSSLFTPRRTRSRKSGWETEL